MTTKTIIGEVVFMAIAAVALIQADVCNDGVGSAIAVVLVSMFAGAGACWRLTHPA